MQADRHADAERRRLTQGYRRESRFYQIVYRLPDDEILRQKREFVRAPWPGKPSPSRG